MLDLLLHASLLAKLALIASFVPVGVAVRARLRGVGVRERTAAWLVVLPVVAAALVLRETWTILHPPPAMKLDPRTFAFLRATEAVVLVGPTIAASAGLTAAIAPSLRRILLPTLPVALVLAAWSVATVGRLRTFAEADPAAKEALWTEWLPVHLGVVALAVACAAAGARRGGALPTLLILPLLLWPAWWPLVALWR